MYTNFNSETYTTDYVPLSTPEGYTYKLDTINTNWIIDPTISHSLYSQEASTILSGLQEILKEHSDIDTSIAIDRETDNTIKLICVRNGKELYITLSKTNILECSFLYISSNHEHTILTEKYTVNSLKELYNKIDNIFEKIQTLELLSQ